jgi:hypothetical protein
LGGETTYSISFTDGDQKDVLLKGVHKITITSVPKMVKSTLPTYLPDPKTDKDKDGKPYVEGMTYTWGSGDTAILRNGQWVPTMRRNPVCFSQQ